MDFALRNWKYEDAISVASYANNIKIARNLRDAFPFPYTIDDAEQFIDSCIREESNGQTTRAIVINGKAVGSIGVFLQRDVYQKSAEIGYWLGEAFWGHGIMPKAIGQMCAEAFRKFRLERIYAEVFAQNLASARALEKAGFVLEGILRHSVYKNGLLQDGKMYSLLKDEIQTRQPLLFKRATVHEI